MQKFWKPKAYRRQVFEKFCAQSDKMLKLHQAAQCKSFGNLRLIDVGH
jgi:hypothetical protein